VALGRIDPAAKLAGTLELDAALAEAALARAGAPLGLDPVEVAAGMVAIVEETMAGAIRKVSIEQGADPRDARLVAFGGAGGLHAVALARRLSMAGAVIPLHAGVFSALGLLLSPPRVDAVTGVVMDRTHAAGLPHLVAEVAAAAVARLESAGAPPAAVRTSVDARYLGQAHEVSVECDRRADWEEVAADFHRLHHERNGFSRPDDPIEVVAVRAEAEGGPPLRWQDLPPVAPAGPDRAGTRPLVGDAGPVSAARWLRAGLRPGTELPGPAVVEETEATTYLPAGTRGRVHESGAIEVEW
jgi:N-methylhydantoinase A